MVNIEKIKSVLKENDMDFRIGNVRLQPDLEVFAYCDFKGKGLTFYDRDNSENELKKWKKTTNCLIICSSNNNLDFLKEGPFIFTSNPKLAFIQILRIIFPDKNDFSIHPDSIISPDAICKGKVSIGPKSIINKAIIGHNCHIGSSVVINDGVEIGDNAVIGDCVVLGSTLPGGAKNKDGYEVDFPCISGLIIGDNVRIESGSVVSLGTLRNTVIEDGVKICSNVTVGRGCSIGKNVFISTGVNLGGSCSIGENSFLGLGSAIRESVSVPSETIVGMNTSIYKSYSKSGLTLVSSKTAILERRNVE